MALFPLLSDTKGSKANDTVKQNCNLRAQLQCRQVFMLYVLGLTEVIFCECSPRSCFSLSHMQGWTLFPVRSSWKFSDACVVHLAFGRVLLTSIFIPWVVHRHLGIKIEGENHINIRTHFISCPAKMEIDFQGTSFWIIFWREEATH